MRRALFSFIVLTTLILTGCSASPDGLTLEAGADVDAPAVEVPSLTTFRSLATQVESTASRFEMVMNMESDFFSMVMPMSGAADGDRMAMTIDMSQMSVPGLAAAEQAQLDGLKIEMILVPPFMYMNLGGLDGGVFGSDWIGIDITQSAGADELLEGFGGMGTDPFGSLGLLEQADRFEEVGPETVRGVETTRYRLIVNPATAWAELDDEGRAALEGAIGEFGAAPPDVDLPYDVWLDEQGRARRLSFAMGTELLGQLAGESADAAELQGLGDFAMTMTMEIFDYGDPSIVIEAPAGAIDMTEMFGDLGG